MKFKYDGKSRPTNKAYDESPGTGSLDQIQWLKKLGLLNLNHK